MPKPYPYDFTRSLITRRDQLVRRKFTYIDYGVNTFFVPLGGNIQEAINRCVSVGGGTVILDAGTYSQTTALVTYSSVALQGVSPSATIIDFGSTSANISAAGTSVYSTGNVTIASGVTVTGGGTAWLANASAGQHMFIGTRWYKIAAVIANDTIILAEGFGDTPVVAGAYRIATVVENMKIQGVSFKNSTGTAIAVTDARKVTITDVECVTNNKGAVLTNCSELNVERAVLAASTSNGVELTNVGLSDCESFNSVSNGGSNFVLNNVKTCSFYACAGNGATADGWNMTTVVDCVFLLDASGNGGQGIECVSACNGNELRGPVRFNTSDGIKLTATSDKNKIVFSTIESNGGYGVNVAASTCDDNIILGNTFASNSTAASNDSGTGTLIRSNIGLSDN